MEYGKLSELAQRVITGHDLIKMRSREGLQAVAEMSKR